MYIELYNYEKEDKTIEGEYIGYVSLEEDDVYIDVDDEGLAGKLEELFSESIIFKNPAGLEKEAEPYTREFFRHVLDHLADLALKGKLKEDDETEAYVKRPVVLDEEEDEDEEDEELPPDMSVEEIDDMEDLEDDDYDDLEEEERDVREEDEEDYM
jgi:hypothetical protein